MDLEQNAFDIGQIPYPAIHHGSTKVFARAAQGCQTLLPLLEFRPKFHQAFEPFADAGEQGSGFVTGIMRLESHGLAPAFSSFLRISSLGSSARDRVQASRAFCESLRAA